LWIVESFSAGLPLARQAVDAGYGCIPPVPPRPRDSQPRIPDGEPAA
jgi:hypothetical protein